MKFFIEIDFLKGGLGSRMTSVWPACLCLGDLLGPVTSTTTTTTANTNLSSSHHLISPTDHRPRHLNHSHHEDQTESEELLHSESLEPEEWQRLKQQRRSIAHPPRRTQNLVAQLDPLVALANQKSASAEDLTLEKRNKKSLQYSNGQSHGKLFQKNKSTSQSLTKMSMQNKFYSQRYHGGSKYSQSQHSSSKSSLGLTSGLYEGWSLTHSYHINNTVLLIEKLNWDCFTTYIITSIFIAANTTHLIWETLRVRETRGHKRQKGVI